jgi:hypothetical protein
MMSRGLAVLVGVLWFFLVFLGRRGGWGSRRRR